MIVVDLGCMPHGHEVSIDPLVERFHPEVLYGFDPYLNGHAKTYEIGDTRVELDSRAAWIFNGEIEWVRTTGPIAWDSTVMREKNSRAEWMRGEIHTVACFDVSEFVLGLPEPPVVKFDIEGAEFPILEHMHETGADQACESILVEWHDKKMNGDFDKRRQRLQRVLRCGLELWP